MIVHEIPIMCSIIASVLEDEEDIFISGCANTVDEALEMAHDDVNTVLISTRLPDHGALRLTELLAENEPDISVLALGLSERKEDVLPYVEAGALGYVLKNDSIDDLLAVIRSAYSGKARVSPEIAAALMTRVSELYQKFSHLNPELLENEQLTSRELEILELLGKNYSNREISEHLMIEVGTVKNHVHNILNKLNVSSRRQAVNYLAIIKK